MTIANFEASAEGEPRDTDWYCGAVDAARRSTASTQIAVSTDMGVAVPSGRAVS